MSSPETPSTAACELVALKVLLSRRHLHDKANDAMEDFETVVRWTNGGTVQAGGPLSEKIRAAIGYSAADMASMIADAAKLEL